MTKQGRLLLIEDDLSVRDALIRLFETEGFEVVTAGSSAEAVLACTQEAISVVLLDLNLGDENGWEVFSLLKELREEMPIIVISAHASLLTHSSSNRASGVLEKPFEVVALLDLLHQTRPGISLAEPPTSLNLSFRGACDLPTPSSESVGHMRE